MIKDRSWMYRSIKSSEFIDGVLEFCSIVVEHQVKTGGVGFRPQYHVWVWHGQEGVYKEKCC